MYSHSLKLERELRGWSQAKVAEAVKTSVRSIIRWEQGQSLPTPYYREQLCLLFNKNARDLGLLQTIAKELEAPREFAKAHVQRSEAGEALLLPVASPIMDPTIPEPVGYFSSLLGREDLLIQIKQRLFYGESLAMTALNGLPGIGKTALAVAIAADPEVQAHFQDGILWAGLGARPNVLGQMARWGKLLGIKPTEVEDSNSRESWGSALRAAIGSRRMLLIIDDAWNAHTALAFRVGGSACAHLLTTRLPQVAIAFAQNGFIQVPELEPADGLRLLACFIPQVVENHPGEAHALVQAVGNLPLALILIGKYLTSRAFTGQPRRLQTAMDQLHDIQQRFQISVPTAPGERSPSLEEQVPLSLQATIAISDQHLSPPAHTALCALAVFPPKPANFSEAAALEVSGQPIEIVDELWDAGLLESASPGRYTIHQTIVDYARLLEEDPAAAQQRLINYMLHYTQIYEREYADLEAEMSSILAALDTANSIQATDALIKGILTLVPFMRVRGFYAQADHYLQQAFQAVTAQNDQGNCMTMLCHLANFAELRGYYLQAEHYARQGLLLARQLEHNETIIAFLTVLGLAAFHQGDSIQATQFYNEGLILAQQQHLRTQISTLLGNLGMIATRQDKYPQALQLYEEALQIAQQEQQQELICRLFGYMGFASFRMNNYPQAEQYLQQGLTLARLLGHREYQSSLLNDLAVLVTVWHGDNDQARIYSLEAIELVRSIGHRTQLCRQLINVGGMFSDQGNYSGAEPYLQEALLIARQLPRYANMPILLASLGHVVGMQKEYQQANTYLRESLELAYEADNSRMLCTILYLQGDVHLKHQYIEAAEKSFQSALSLNTKPDLDLLGPTLYGLACVALARGDILTARRLGQESQAVFEAIDNHQVKEVRQWLADLPTEH